MRSSLPAAARATFDALQAFPRAGELQVALATLEPELRSTARFLRRAGDEGWRDVTAPRALLARLRAREWTEAAHLGRRHLLRVVLPRLFPFCAEEDVTALPPSLSAVIRSLHGLEAVEPFERQPVAQARERLARLARQLGVAGSLGATVRRALG